MKEPEKKGDYYIVELDDNRGTKVFVPREQHTAFTDVLEGLKETAIGKVCNKITISIW